MSLEQEGAEGLSQVSLRDRLVATSEIFRCDKYLLYPDLGDFPAYQIPRVLLNHVKIVSLLDIPRENINPLFELQNAVIKLLESGSKNPFALASKESINAYINLAQMHLAVGEFSEGSEILNQLNPDDVIDIKLEIANEIMERPMTEDGWVFINDIFDHRGDYDPEQLVNTLLRRASIQPTLENKITDLMDTLELLGTFNKPTAGTFDFAYEKIALNLANLAKNEPEMHSFTDKILTTVEKLIGENVGGYNRNAEGLTIASIDLFDQAISSWDLGSSYLSPDNDIRLTEYMADMMEVNSPLLKPLILANPNLNPFKLFVEQHSKKELLITRILANMLQMFPVNTVFNYDRYKKIQLTPEELSNLREVEVVELNNLSSEDEELKNALEILGLSK